ncbi:MAG: phage tail protein [Psychromonas sp.]
MKALQSLTELFIASVVDAKQVELWAEDGELRSAPDFVVDGFEIAYTININMVGVALSPHILMMHLLNWLNKYDVNRAEKGLPNPSFATELLDNGKCDIKLKVDIREDYSLIKSEKGNWSVDNVRYECVSDFSSVVTESELDHLHFLGGHENDLPS